MKEVVDVKIRTRAMAAARGMKMTTKKVTTASTTPYNVYELRSRRRSRRNNSTSSPVSYQTETTTFEDATNCTSSSIGSEVIVSSLDFPSSSCCSSNVMASLSSSELFKNCVSNASEIVPDPEVESGGGEASSKFVDCNKPASFSLSPHINSMENVSHVNISENSSAFETKKLEQSEMEGLDYASMKSTVEIKPMMMPSKSEIDEFFSSAEKDLQKRFSDKYNFDIVKDVPLKGRYEWVQIKP